MGTLIRRVELWRRPGRFDVRIRQGRVGAIAPRLDPAPGETVVDGAGGLLLPGLHDHHIHLCALAAAAESVPCGPPAVRSGAELAARLARARGEGWLRGVGYDPQVVGEIDRAWLDRVVPHRPVRLQHRGGRLWVVNSAALRALGLPCAGQPAGVEMAEGAPTGRLYDCDRWLAARLESRPPSLAAVSRRLAAYGVTGVTDATPANDLQSWRHFAAEQARGHLLQRVRLMGGEELAQVSATPTLAPGEFKIHLLESRLPPFAELCAQVAAAHETGRAVAIHCVTAVELAFALGALAEVGARRGDRIEHAAVAPPPLAARIAELGLRVVSQPQLVAERGDRYLAEVEVADRLWLWRLAGLRAAGISLAGGSDAPFGSPDPWAAMRAAVARRTAAGLRLGPAEALSPEEALELFLHPLDAPGCGVRRVAVGVVADLVLLALPWARLRLDLDARHVRAVWRDGSPIHGGFG